MADAVSDKGGAAFAYIRLIAYIDKQTNGNAAQIRDLLDTHIIDGDTTVDPVVPPVPECPLVHCWRNLDNVDRYIILKDKRWVARMNDAVSGDYLNQPSGGTSAISPKYRVSDPIIIKTNLKLKNLPIEYSGTTGSVSEIRANSVQYAIMMTRYDTTGSTIADDNNNPDTTVWARFNGIHRISYTDV